MNRPTDLGAHPCSSNILEEARRSEKGYSSRTTRKAFADAVKVAFNRNTSRDFQLDLAVALILGLDTTVVVGAGSGKTLPWATPLLLDENKGCGLTSSESALSISALIAVLMVDSA